METRTVRCTNCKSLEISNKGLKDFKLCNKPTKPKKQRPDVNVFPSLIVTNALMRGQKSWVHWKKINIIYLA